MGKISVVTGGQYGSEAKGHCAGWLASTEQNPPHTEVRVEERVEPVAQLGAPVVGVRVGGPNAGHVVVSERGRFALQQIPVAAVTNTAAQLVVAAGSEIDPKVLMEELDALDAVGHDASARLIIDPQATLLEPHHAELESKGRPHGDAGLTKDIGSTGKGVGAARADRLMRRAMTVGGFLDGSHGTVWRELCNRGVVAIDTAEYLRQALGDGAHVVIEGTQGYGLGLRAGHYPYCTSGDCRAIDFLAQAGVNPWQDATVKADGHRWLAHDFDVWVVLRPYPIRVAGNSGPMLGETSWEALGLPEEWTTVTKKIRRVGEWDPDLARQAMAANGGSACKIFLSMADQVIPEIAGWGDSEWAAELAGQRGPQLAATAQLVETVERDTGARVYQVGTGPNTSIAWRS